MALNEVSKCSKELAKSAKDDNDLPEGGVDMEQLKVV